MMDTKAGAYEMVNHPKHYNTYSVEAIEMMKRIYGEGCVAIWDEITSFKYRMRMGTKPNSTIEQDLSKESFYVNDKQDILNENCMSPEDFALFIEEVGRLFKSIASGNGKMPMPDCVCSTKKILTD